MKTLFRPRFIEGKNSSPDEPSAGNEFSSAIGKHSSDSSRGVKVVRHRVAPFDIFPRAHATFSRITIGTREEKRILRSEKLLYIYIYIIFPRDVNEETRSSVLGRILLEGRGKEEEKEELLMAESLHVDPRRLNCLGVVTRRNVEKCWNVAAFTSSKKPTL